MKRLELVYNRRTGIVVPLPLAGEKICQGQMTMWYQDQVWIAEQGTTILGVALHDAEVGQPLKVSPQLDGRQVWIAW